MASRAAPQDGAQPEQQPASHQEPGCGQQLARGAFLLDAQQAKVVEHESYPNTQATGRKIFKPNRQEELWTGQPRQSGEMYAPVSPSGAERATRAPSPRQDLYPGRERSASRSGHLSTVARLLAELHVTHSRTRFRMNSQDGPGRSRTSAHGFEALGLNSRFAGESRGEVEAARQGARHSRVAR